MVATHHTLAPRRGTAAIAPTPKSWLTTGREVEASSAAHRRHILRRHFPPGPTQVDVARIRRRRISIEIHETLVTNAHAGQEEHRRSLSGRELFHDDLDDLPNARNVAERTEDRNGTPRTALGERKLYVSCPYRIVRTHLIRMSRSVIENPSNGERRDHRENREDLDHAPAPPSGQGSSRVSFAIRGAVNVTRLARH